MESGYYWIRLINNPENFPLVIGYFTSRGWLIDGYDMMLNESEVIVKSAKLIPPSE